jgi:hypothetical protein
MLATLQFRNSHLPASNLKAYLLRYTKMLFYLSLFDGANGKNTDEGILGKGC